MARIAGGLGTSHVPMIGRTIAANRQQVFVQGVAGLRRDVPRAHTVQCEPANRRVAAGIKAFALRQVADDDRLAGVIERLAGNTPRHAHPSAGSEDDAARARDDPEQLRGYLNWIFVSRCLERVGDHAANIAEDAVYAAAAEDIRHQPQIPAAER